MFGAVGFGVSVWSTASCFCFCVCFFFFFNFLSHQPGGFFAQNLLKYIHQASVFWVLSSEFLNPSIRLKHSPFLYLLKKFFLTEICFYCLGTTLQQKRLRNTLPVSCMAGLYHSPGWCWYPWTLQTALPQCFGVFLSLVLSVWWVWQAVPRCF